MAPKWLSYCTIAVASAIHQSLDCSVSIFTRVVRKEVRVGKRWVGNVEEFSTNPTYKPKGHGIQVTTCNHNPNNEFSKKGACFG